MGFDAKAQVDPLDYDFRPYVEAWGTVPEPSERAINKFIGQWQTLIREMTRLSMTSEEAAAKDASELTEEEIAEQEEIEQNLPTTVDEALAKVRNSSVNLEESESVTEELIDITAKVCQDNPDAETLRALPGRIRVAFLGWIVGELANPEPVAADTRPDLKAV